MPASLLFLLWACLAIWSAPARAADQDYVLPQFSFGGVSAGPSSGPAEAAGDTRVVTLWGDHLEYDRDNDLVLASGNVCLQQGASRLYAGQVLFNVKDNWIQAEDSVVWKQGNQVVYADKIHLNMKTQVGRAEGVLFQEPPWLAGGRTIEKTGDRDIFIHSADMTTCTREHPHYRLGARTIKVVLDQSISITNMVLYIGIVPVFYFPYFSRNLHDDRPPLLLRPGNDTYQGYNLHTIYNYYLTDNQYGSLEYDWMQLLGNGEGLSHHYKLLGGEGEFGGYYNRLPGTDLFEWSARASHRQNFGHGYTLQADYEQVSDPNFNNIYGQYDVDPAQQRRYLSLQSSQPAYAWNAIVQENISLSPTASAPTTYHPFISQAVFPSITFNTFSRPLIPYTTLYGSFASSYVRSYAPPALTYTVASPLSSTAVPSPLAYVYSDVLSMAPSVAYSMRLPHRQTLSANLSLNGNYNLVEGQQGGGDVNASYTGSLDLQTRWKYGFTSDVVDSFSQQLSHLADLPFNGVTQHRVELRGDESLDKLHLFLTQGIDLRPFRTQELGDRFELGHFQGTYMPANSFYNLSLSSAFYLPLGINNLDGSVNLFDAKRGWQVSLSTSWANNALVQTASPADPDGLAVYRWSGAPSTDVWLLNATTSFPVGPLYRVNLFGSFDMTHQGTMQQSSVGLWRDLDCWEMEVSASWRQNPDPASPQPYIIQYGFSINIKAFPQFKAALPGGTNGYGADPMSGAFSGR